MRNFADDRQLRGTLSPGLLPVLRPGRESIRRRAEETSKPHERTGRPAPGPLRRALEALREAARDLMRAVAG